MRSTPRALFSSPRRGAFTVEFALCVSLGLLPVVFGIIDWSWYFFQQMTVQAMFYEAAHAGAAVDVSLACPGDKAETTLSDSLDAWNLSGAEISSSIDSYEFGIGGTTDLWEMSLALSVPFTPLIGWPISPPSTLGFPAYTVPLEDQEHTPSDYGCG